MGGKIIKKTYKIIFFFFLAILSLPTGAYFLLQQKLVQKYLVDKISQRLSEYFGTEITVTRTNFDIFNTISLYNFCVHEKGNKDTILYVPELKIKLSALTFASHLAEFKKVTFIHPDIHFRIDSLNTINFQFIIDKLESHDTISSKKPWKFAVKEVNIEHAHFGLKSYSKNNVPYGVNFTDLYFKDLNLKVTGFSIEEGVISMNIRQLSGTENSGFQLVNFSSRLKINKRYMVYNNVEVQTRKSRIHALQVHFNFDNFKQFKAGIFGKVVKLDIEVKKSEISVDDLSMFLPVMKDYHLKALITGKFTGTLYDLHGKDLDISYGTHTRLRASFDLLGLPNLDKSYLNANIQRFSTTFEDAVTIPLPYSQNGHVVLPDFLRTYGETTFSGKFIGFFDHFETNGVFTNDLGKVEADLKVKPDTFSQNHCYEGFIKATDLNLGKIIKRQDLIGNITLEANLSGPSLEQMFQDATVDGLISSFDFKGYEYTKTVVSGKIENNVYSGKIVFNDPCLMANLSGIVNLTGQIPSFNVNAEIKQAKLFPLNFDKSDSLSELRLNAKADFLASNFDNINGDFKLDKVSFKKSTKQFSIEEMSVHSKQWSDSSQVIVQSDVMNASIFGKYRFESLIPSFQAMMRNYLPSVFNKFDTTGSIGNDFRFDFQFKNTKAITDYFITGLYLSKDSRLSGTYCPLENNCTFLFTVPLLQYVNKKWYKAYFLGYSMNGNYSFESGCDNLKINNSNRFDNLTIIADIRHDSIYTKIRWNNWDSISYKGNLSFHTLFGLDSNGHMYTTFRVCPSLVTIHDSIWNIGSGSIEIDSSEIHIQDLVFQHNEQEIKIKGFISKDKNKALSATFQRVGLDNLNTLLLNKNISMNGLLNGMAEVSNLYYHPIIHASLVADSFYFNHIPVGVASILTTYNSLEKNVDIEARLGKSSDRSLYAIGTYGVDSKNLDFKMDFHNLNIEVFSPFIESVFSDIHGNANGEMTLGGKLGKPLLGGNVTLNNTSFNLNYLKTSYYTTGNTVQIRNNTFTFTDFEVKDNREDKSIVNGKISAENLKDLYIDLSINADHFECLNTTEQDNAQFYGHAFATGQVIVKGYPNSLDINVSHARTERNTIIYIPLGSNSELYAANFITLQGKVNSREPESTNYEIDTIVKKENANSTFNQGLKLNINLDATSDAEVQIVFDQKIGDLIKGHGTGNLSLVVDRGNFNMYGNYNIESGDYLFTMQNVINKKFTIESGSSIIWNGDPVDATVNIQAAYKLRAMLSELTGPSTSGASLASLDNLDKKRMPVECRLFLTNKLMNPTIRYDINLPNASPEAKNFLNMFVNTDDELSRQFLMLLVMGSFTQSANSTAVSSGNFPFSTNSTQVGSSCRVNRFGIFIQPIFQNAFSV